MENKENINKEPSTKALLIEEELSALTDAKPREGGGAQSRERQHRITTYDFRRPDRVSKEQVRSLYFNSLDRKIGTDKSVRVLKYHGNVDKVLAGCNAGIGNVERYGSVPPFRETRNFVTSVKKNYRHLVASNHTSAPSMLATSDATPKSKHSGMKVKGTEGGNEALEAFLSQRSQPTKQPVSLSPQVTNQTSADSNDMQLPVQGRISPAFGAHRHNRHHQGVDIAAARGTPIETSAGGEVVFAG